MMVIRLKMSLPHPWLAAKGLWREDENQMMFFGRTWHKLPGWAQWLVFVLLIILGMSIVGPEPRP